jgi:hypothetical protein
VQIAVGKRWWQSGRRSAAANKVRAAARRRGCSTALCYAKAGTVTAYERIWCQQFPRLHTCRLLETECRTHGCCCLPQSGSLSLRFEGAKRLLRHIKATDDLVVAVRARCSSPSLIHECGCPAYAAAELLFSLTSLAHPHSPPVTQGSAERGRLWGRGMFERRPRARCASAASAASGRCSAERDRWEDLDHCGRWSTRSPDWPDEQPTPCASWSSPPLAFGAVF